VSYFRLL